MAVAQVITILYRYNRAHKQTILVHFQQQVHVSHIGKGKGKGKRVFV